MYNIKNDILHKWAKTFITSKMMLYKIGTHFILNQKQINTHCACITMESYTGNAEGNLQKQRLARKEGLQFTVQIQSNYSCPIEKQFKS